LGFVIAGGAVRAVVGVSIVEIDGELRMSGGVGNLSTALLFCPYSPKCLELIS
jgi:hypothetical protein